MSEIPFSRQGERVVTSFVGQEFLYDYLRGQLDAQRVESLERLLSEDRDLRMELEKIREALHYVDRLRETRVSAALVDRVRTPSTYLHQLLQKSRFSEWPEGVKFATEAVIVALGALTLILFLPWGRLLTWKKDLENTSMTLTEVTRTQSADPDGSGVAAPTTAPPLYEDEMKNTEVAAPIVKVGQVAHASPTPKPTPARPAATPSATTAKAAAVAQGAAEESAPDAGKKAGFLFRGSLEVTNLEAVTPKLVEFITEKGGRKAGDVDLGWKKGKGNYFHFTIPEANYQVLQDFLASYGALKIAKEPHPRVMPDGIIRLIITVNEKK